MWLRVVPFAHPVCGRGWGRFSTLLLPRVGPGTSWQSVVAAIDHPRWKKRGWRLLCLDPQGRKIPAAPGRWEPAPVLQGVGGGLRGSWWLSSLLGEGEQQRGRLRPQLLPGLCAGTAETAGARQNKGTSMPSPRRGRAAAGHRCYRGARGGRGRAGRGCSHASSLPPGPAGRGGNQMLPAAAAAADKARRFRRARARGSRPPGPPRATSRRACAMLRDVARLGTAAPGGPRAAVT